MSVDSAPPLAPPPDLIPGTWVIDPVHSTAAFAVRHAAVSTVRGTIAIADGTIEVGKTLAGSSVRVTLDPSSVDTRSSARDSHLRSTEFFHVDAFPVWSFVSTGVFPGRAGEYTVRGDLTIHGHTRPVDLATVFEGVGDDFAGHLIAGFSATAQIARRDYGLEWAGRSQVGNAIVGNAVAIQLDVAAVHQV